MIRRFRKYLLGVGVALEYLAIALLGGDVETISSRAARARNKGKLWGCHLCRFLDWLDPDHCDNTEGHKNG